MNALKVYADFIQARMDEETLRQIKTDKMFEELMDGELTDKDIKDFFDAI